MSADTLMVRMFADGFTLGVLFMSLVAVSMKLYYDNKKNK